MIHNCGVIQLLDDVSDNVEIYQQLSALLPILLSLRLLLCLSLPSSTFCFVLFLFSTTPVFSHNLFAFL